MSPGCQRQSSGFLSMNLSSTDSKNSSVSKPMLLLNTAYTGNLLAVKIPTSSTSGADAIFFISSVLKEFAEEFPIFSSVTFLAMVRNVLPRLSLSRLPCNNSLKFHQSITDNKSSVVPIHRADRAIQSFDLAPLLKISFFTKELFTDSVFWYS